MIDNNHQLNNLFDIAKSAGFPVDTAKHDRCARWLNLCRVVKGPGGYECCICNSIFAFDESVESHMMTHSPMELLAKI